MKAAKISHFAAKAVAHGFLPYHGYPYSFYPYTAYTGETPEVVAAKAAHFAAHARANTRLIYGY